VNTTTHEGHNNQSLVRLVLWESLEYEGCLEMEEWSPICNFYFVDTCGLPEGSMPRCQVTLDFGPQKRSNPISNSYRASDTFMARV
jgi:hypothetical protein